MAHEGFIDLTPFSAGQYLLADESGADVLTIVVKATYAITGTSTVELAEEQAEILAAPEHYGEPETSSIKCDSEVCFVKPATDAVLIGHAHSNPEDREKIDVSLSIGPLRKTVRVFGNRCWKTRLGLRWATRPEPFEKIPLTYEHAFGGWYRVGDDPSKHTCDARNPVGRGFVPRKHKGVPGEFLLPNLEDPAHLLRRPGDCPTPAGFGFIAPGWLPRSRFAGTYDEGWQRNRMPLLPEDFDRRYFSAAHPDLVAPGFLRGGEPVEITNASSRGTLRFLLPKVTPEAVVMFKDGNRQAIEMKLDTVIINTDEDLLFLIWRAHVSVWGKTYDIVWAKTQLKGTGSA